jgi:hypothetical protein
LELFENKLTSKKDVNIFVPPKRKLKKKFENKSISLHLSYFIMFSMTASTPSFKGYNTSDLHAWVVVKKSQKIMDYPINTLKSLSMMGTDKLRYVPFDDIHQDKLIKIWSKKLDGKYKLEGLSREDVDNTYVLNGGYCFFRALIIHRKLKEKGIKSKVVFGSLGFVQSNGSVFYEFG